MRHPRRPYLRTTALLLAGAAVLAGGAAGCDSLTRPRAAASAKPSHLTATPSRAASSPTPHASATTPAPAGAPAGFAPQVREYAGQAGIDPQLLMAILYNESYKPHDPGFERAWAKIDPDPAFGVANMHKAAFDDTKRGRDFADRDWTELPDDPSLAIEAAAWYLHDLAAQLPSSWPAHYTKDELLALGYNAGPGSMRQFAQGGTPGPTARSYLDRLHDNWDTAAKALG